MEGLIFSNFIIRGNTENFSEDAFSDGGEITVKGNSVKTKDFSEALRCTEQFRKFLLQWN